MVVVPPTRGRLVQQERLDVHPLFVGERCSLGAEQRRGTRPDAILDCCLSARLVDDEHAAVFVTEVLHDVLAQVVAHCLGTPSRRVQ